MPGIGTRIGPSRGRGKSVPFVGMVLSGSGSQAEGTATGTAIGTLSVVGGTGTYTFTKTADPDSAFTLTAGVLKNAIVFDYETAATHSVTLHADNGAGSTFDLTISVVVTDVAAPVLSAATDAATGSSTATLGVTTTGADGTLYAVVTTSATPPSAAQVKAGQNNAGGAAAFAGNQAISASGAKTINATGLSDNTTYYSYFMHEGLPAEKSAVAVAASFITDALPAPVNTVAPAITGTETVGSTLTTTNGTWTNSPSSYTYQWYQSVTSGGVPTTDVDGNYIGIAISGETASTYVLQAGDVGELIFCDVTATNSGGSTVKSSNVTGAIAALPSFTGLGDVVGSALFFWGLRAYSAAKAAAAVDCIDIIDITFSFTSTLGVQSDGNLNTTVIKSGHMAGSTLAAWVVAHGTPFVHKVYDQIGSYHLTSTVLTGPELDMTLYGGKGGMKFTGSAWLQSSATMTQTQPYSVATVSKRTGSTASNDGILGTESPYPCLLAYNSVSGELGPYLGSNNVGVAGVSEGTGHAVQWICNGASTIINIDGADIVGGGASPIGTNPGTATISGSKLSMGERAGGTTIGDITEICMWAGATSGPNYAAVAANQKTWWGTP